MSDQEVDWRDPDFHCPYRETFEGSTKIYGRISQNPEKLSEEHLFDLQLNLQIHGEEAEQAIMDLKNDQFAFMEAEEADEELMSVVECELAAGFIPRQDMYATEQDMAMTHEERVAEVKHLQSWVRMLLEKEKYQKCLTIVMDLECQITTLGVPKFEPYMADVLRTPPDIHCSKPFIGNSGTHGPRRVIWFEDLFAFLADLNDISGETTAQQLAIPKHFQSLHTRLINIQLKYYEGKGRIKEFETSIPEISPLNRQHQIEREKMAHNVPQARRRRKPAPHRTSVSHGRSDTGQAQLINLVPDPLPLSKAHRPRPEAASLAPTPATVAPGTPKAQLVIVIPRTPGRRQPPSIAPATPSTVRRIARDRSITPKQKEKEVLKTPRHFHERGESSTAPQNPFTGILVNKINNSTSSTIRLVNTNTTSAISGDQEIGIASLLQDLENSILEDGGM